MKRNIFQNLLGMLAAALFFLPAVQAQGVPGAIKYQAVLRDVNGKTLTDKSDVNIRISLRLDDPEGTIAYSEVHENLSTNAYGVIHLEIGRGEVTSGTTLNAIAWGEHEVYVQLEIETDGTGYTNMGKSELITVPYAFYAENASGKNLYDNLRDNFLPKYNDANKTLVNSGLSQVGRALEVDASSITFVDKASGKIGYTFPAETGKKGQVLRLKDNMGTLFWDTAGGGGSGSGSVELDGDGQMVYWDGTQGELATAPFVFDYNGSKNFSLTGGFSVMGTVADPVFSANNTGVAINRSVSGNNNLLTSNGLNDGQIWIGDGNANTASSLEPRTLSGHILMDKTGKTSLNLVLKGLRLASGTTQDTLMSESDSLWARNAAGNLYSYNQGRDLEQTFVGIGTDNPVAMLHVHGGSVRFTGNPDADGKKPVFSWNPEKSSLFSGALDDMDDLNDLGKYSVSLGLNALATKDHGLALGQSANVQGEEAVAIGVQSRAEADRSVALGRQAQVTGDASVNGVAIGYQTTVESENTVVLGGNSKAKSNSVVIGYDNGTAESIGGSVVVGNGTTRATNAIVIGNNASTADGNILIGNDIFGQSGSVVVGSNNASGFAKGQVVLGYANSKDAGIIVSVGNGNECDGGDKINMLGSNLNLNGASGNMTVVGNDFSYYDLSMSNTEENADPAFAVGEGQGLFEISPSGNAYFIGDVRAQRVYANGVQLTSDIRLKTDIKPMFLAPALLDSLQPVSFVYKSDKKRQTRFGFIAQEVRKVFPELVMENNKGMLSMDYIGLVPVLWQINQQLSQKLNELEQRVEEQNRKQLELENELQAIKAKIGL